MTSVPYKDIRYYGYYSSRKRAKRKELDGYSKDITDTILQERGLKKELCPVILKREILQRLKVHR
jgi:hypothetical protein